MHSLPNWTRSAAAAPPDNANAQPVTRIPALSRSTVPATAWSIFVHQSPIYVTSELPLRRQSRPGTRPSGRSTRHSRRSLALYDGYPYANRRWSRRLTSAEESS